MLENIFNLILHYRTSVGSIQPNFNFEFILFSIIYLVFGAIVWRLRGGAWETFTPLKFGTSVTRAITGILLSLPLFFITSNIWLVCLLALSIFTSLSVLGWGPYMDIGEHSPSNPGSPSWIDFFPRLFGFQRYTVSWDVIGMVACGLIMFGIDVLPFVVLSFNWYLISLAVLSGILFAVMYWFVYRVLPTSLPSIKGLVINGSQGQWSEVIVGILVAATFLGWIMLTN